MNEVAALNTAWVSFAKKVGLPGTMYWEEGFRRYSYGAKVIFDRGWEEAMRYRDGEENA